MNASTSMMNVPAPSARSTLVSVLGWIAIACGALNACAALWQFQLFGSLAEVPAPPIDPAVQEGLFRWFQGISVVNVAIAGFLMYAGYALLKRRNWARKTFIVLFALGIVANVIWIAFSAAFGSLFGQLGAAFGAVFVVVAIFGLGVIALFAWLIRRLRSAAVTSEFV